MRKAIFLFTLLFYFVTFLHSQNANVDSLSIYVKSAITVTATKYQTELKKLPVIVNSINESLISTQINSNPNIGEYVRNLPGVSVGHGNRNIPPWIHMRGTGYFIGRTLYMVDELPLIEPRLCIAFNPENASSIDVILGPSSSLYGPNASGGALNIISKTGLDQSSIIIGQNIGSFTTYRPSISVGKAFENFHFYGSFNLDDSKGYKNTDLNTGVYLFKNGLPSYLNYVAIEDEKYTNTYFSGSLGYKNDLNTFGITLNAHYFNEDKYGGKQNSTTDGYRMLGSGKIYYTIPDILKSTLRFGYQNLTGNTQSTKGAVLVSNNAINGRYIFVQKDANNSYVYDPTITSKGESKNQSIPIDLQNDIYLLRDHIITIGGSFIKDSYNSKTYNADKTKLNAETRYKIDRSAIYAQLYSKLFEDKLFALLGFRYDKWTYTDIYDMGSTIKNPPDVSKDAFNFRGGLKYFISNELQIRTSYGTAFWPGTATWFFQNLSTGNTWREANPGLKPEKTNMVDAGIDFSSQNEYFNCSATIYYGKIIDAITYRYDQHPTLPGVQIIRTQNSDEVKIKGLELSANYKIFTFFTLNGNLTFNKSEITKSPTNKGHRLRNAPDYFGNMAILYANQDLINFKLSMRFSDDRYYDDENTQLDYYHMKPYTVFDAKIWKSLYLLSGEFIISLGFDNIFNKKYDGEFVYNAPGRYVEFGVKYKFSI